jgi:hypothetical protein
MMALLGRRKAAAGAIPVSHLEATRESALAATRANPLAEIPADLRVATRESALAVTRANPLAEIRASLPVRTPTEAGLTRIDPQVEIAVWATKLETTKREVAATRRVITIRVATLTKIVAKGTTTIARTAATIPRVTTTPLVIELETTELVAATISIRNGGKETIVVSALAVTRTIPVANTTVEAGVTREMAVLRDRETTPR